MNLNEYPTPRSDLFYLSFADGTACPSQAEWLTKLQDMEREAAAWRAVAEDLAENPRNLAWLDRGPFSDNPSPSDRAIQAFDALKLQLNQP